MSSRRLLNSATDITELGGVTAKVSLLKNISNFFSFTPFIAPVVQGYHPTADYPTIISRLDTRIKCEHRQTNAGTTRKIAFDGDFTWSSIDSG